MYRSFRLKKAVLAAMAVFLAAAVLLLSGAALIKKKEGLAVPVIMYHGLVDDRSKQNRYMIDPSRLEDDLEYLTSSGYHTVFISELIESVENNAPLPDKPVVLTFDDGYLNNYLYAFPLLKKYGYKAVISPIASATDNAENEKYRSNAYSQCKWSELKEMCDSGLVELQNHTFDLHSIKGGIQGLQRRKNESQQDYEQRLQSDLLKANKLIAENTGVTPSALTLPFGAGGSNAVSAAKMLGFRAVLDCEEKLNIISSPEDLFHIHRFLRPNDISSEDYFRHILSKNPQ